MRLVLLGAPGAGKGTQAVVISEKLDIPHISTGDIFRSHIRSGTELGLKAKQYIDEGKLVPDELTIEIVKNRIAQDDCCRGFILDGFPRTIPQADYLEEALGELGKELDCVLNLHVPDEEIIRRLSGRRVCPHCGASYHILYKPTKTEGVCDVCGNKTVQRDDDREETVLKRLNAYHEQTEPLIRYYEKKGKLVTVVGRERVEDTSAAVLQALGVK